MWQPVNSLMDRLVLTVSGNKHIHSSSSSCCQSGSNDGNNTSCVIIVISGKHTIRTA